MIKIKYHENMERNLNKYPCRNGNEWPCIFCGKRVNIRTAKFWVRVGNGGTHIVSDKEQVALGPASDLGMNPVGADCWKVHKEAHPYRDGEHPVPNKRSKTQGRHKKSRRG